MKDQEVSQKILERLEKENITPKPRWTFLVKDYVLWFSGILSLAIGSLSVAAIIYMLANNNWDLVEYSSQSLTKYIFLSLPYIWIVFLAIFIASTYLNLRNTKKGYRYALTTIIVSTVFLSIVLGIILYGIGLGRTIDKVLTKNIPIYQKIILQKERPFNQPEKGLLSGIIVSVEDNSNSCKIIDPSEKEWIITPKNEFSFPKNILEEGDLVKIIGKVIDEKTFEACILRTHHIKGQGPMNPGISHDERKSMKMRTIECGEIKLPPMHRSKIFHKN